MLLSAFHLLSLRIPGYRFSVQHFEHSMLSLALIRFASSLLMTAFAFPTEHVSIIPTPKDVNPSTSSSPNLTTVHLKINLTTTASWRPRCWPDISDPDPMERITNPADCSQAVLNMLLEGSDHDLLVWDRLRGWIYGSCGLFLVPAQGLPVHRDTFTRNDIAQCAESLRLACVNEEHGYRGGILPIAAGVFQVAFAGRPTQLSLREWEESITLNGTVNPFRSDDLSEKPIHQEKEVEKTKL